MNELLLSPTPEYIKSKSFSESQEHTTPFGPAVLVSDLGTRQYKDRNEDRGGVELALRPSPRLGFAILDGMGGDQESWDKGLYLYGDKASQIGLEVALDCVIQPDSLDQIPDKAHRRLRQEELRENGFVACWGMIEFDPDGSIILKLRWIGDVEAYVFRGDQIIPLTKIQRTYVKGVDYIANYVTGEQSAQASGSDFMLLPGDQLLVYTDGVGDNLTPEEIRLLTQGRNLSDSIKILDVALRLKMENGLPDDTFRKVADLPIEEALGLLNSHTGSKGSQQGKPDNRTLFMLNITQTQT